MFTHVVDLDIALRILWDGYYGQSVWVHLVLSAAWVLLSLNGPPSHGNY